MGKHVFGEGKKLKDFQVGVPYDAEIESVTEVQSPSYDDKSVMETQLRIVASVTEEPYMNRKVSCFITPTLYASKKGPSKWAKFLAAFYDKVAVGHKYDDSALIGRSCQILLKQSKDGKWFNIETVLAKKGAKLLKAEKATAEELEAARESADDEGGDNSLPPSVPDIQEPVTDDQIPF